MTNAPEPSRQPRSGLARAASALMRASFLLGACGLLCAMLIDAAAVVGRGIGIPVLGSIELVESCVVLMASASLVGTTLGEGHASVHILTERLVTPWRIRMKRLADALSALFFAVLALGSLVVASDLWGGDERTELLQLPLAPLRGLWCVSALGIVVLFVAAAVRRNPRGEPGAR